jgi:hypothetical protein
VEQCFLLIVVCESEGEGPPPEHQVLIASALLEQLATIEAEQRDQMGQSQLELHCGEWDEAWEV